MRLPAGGGGRGGGGSGGGGRGGGGSGGDGGGGLLTHVSCQPDNGSEAAQVDCCWRRARAPELRDVSCARRRPLGLAFCTDVE